MKNHVNWPAALLLVLLAGWVGYATRANRPVAPAQPAVIATVDLEAVFRGLNERGDADVYLKGLAEQLEADGQRRRDEIELLGQDLELYSPASKQYQDVQQQLAEKGFQLQAYLDFAGRKIDAAKSRTLRRIYDGIKEAIREIAREHGYDVVFVDDSVVTLPTDTGEAETMRQISARRMLYTNAEIDITQDVIARMNAESGTVQGG